MPDPEIQKPAFEKRLLYGLLFLFGIVMIGGAIFIKREDFLFLVCWQIILHACYLLIYKSRNAIKLTHLFWAAVFIRFAMPFITPSLSEDVYRFVWDGQITRHGGNPMLSTPDSFLAALPASSPSVGYFSFLHGLINHPQYYTCYPPLMQGIFWLAALVGMHSIEVSVIVIKLFLALADGFTIYFLAKILGKLKRNSGLALLYAFHPLVIIEGSGNAHFEVMQAAFISGSIYFLLAKKTYASALFWGLAIATKLLPLLLLPVWWLHLGLKKGFRFCCISVAILLFAFLPFLSRESIGFFGRSINLFIQQFEFNASVYYLARQIGFWVTGYNQVAMLGPLLLGTFLVIYAFILLKKQKTDFINFVFVSLILFSLYFLFSTTVHPWYIITLLPFAVISNNYFPFLWMTTAFLSYSAYTPHGVHENAWLISIEYIAVVVLFIYEWKRKNRFLFASIERTPAENQFNLN